MKTETILLAVVVLGVGYFVVQSQKQPSRSDADLVRAGADVQRRASERSIGEQLGGLGENLYDKIFG